MMAYHRNSFNYRDNIMLIRRLLTAALLIPGAAGAIARLTGESETLLLEHRELLRRRGLGYPRDRELFLADNTDGPAIRSRRSPRGTRCGGCSGAS
jgi:hypothetical protein